MKVYSLIELVEIYPQVVFDNSILSLSGKLSQKDMSYYRALEFVLKNRRNFFTTEEVFQEHRDINSDKQWYDKISMLVSSHVFRNTEFLEDYHTLLSAFKTLPNFNLVYEAEKKHPYSDFKLVALALCLAKKDKPLAFLSGDRKLNDFIQYIVDFPSKVLKGKESFSSLDIYSFVLSNPAFILYKNERTRIIRPSEARETKAEEERDRALSSQVDGLLRCMLPPRPIDAIDSNAPEKFSN